MLPETMPAWQVLPETTVLGGDLPRSIPQVDVAVAGRGLRSRRSVAFLVAQAALLAAQAALVAQAALLAAQVAILAALWSSSSRSPFRRCGGGATVAPLRP